MEALEKAEQLKNELDSLRPLDAEAEARIMQKFRLDWNYHSNKLEGNSYTYGETKMLLLKGLTAGGKPVRDHEEISGHNEAIDSVIDAIKENIPLTEMFIRHLNKLVLVKPRWTKAKTTDGQPTRKLIKVGEYKTEPNHVETETGIFYFAEPFETPAKMQELVKWFREKRELEETNPILLAAEFHYRFVRIHPFDDGNGRVARLLMNFILMQFGYPPVIIKNEDKQNYLAVLEQADFHILEPFVEYIKQNLVRSLELIIKGAKGEDIEEPEDLDKELALLERRLIQRGKDVEKFKNKESLRELFAELLPNLIREFLASCKRFDRFYLNSFLSVTSSVESSVKKNDTDKLRLHVFTRKEFEENNIPNLIEGLLSRLSSALNSSQYDNLVGLQFEFASEILKRRDIYDDKFSALIVVEFGEKTYVISDIAGQKRFEYLYSELPTEQEVTEIVRAEAKRHKDHLELLVEREKI